MRTTVDIPDEKYKSVKMAAVELNTTVKQLVLDGLDLLLQQKGTQLPARRMQLPLIRSKRADKLEIDSDQVYEIIDFP
jgi:hypothetical protein